MTLDYQQDNWDAKGTPLLLIHGFMGSLHDFDTLIPHLKQPILRVNLRGFGVQTALEADLSMPTQIAALIALLDELSIDKIDVLGYSMGARVALGLAMTHAQRVAHLILESGTAGIADEQTRIQRVQADELQAQAIEKDYASFVTKWENLPLFASQNKLSNSQKEAVRQQRLSQTPQNMATSLRQMGTGSQPNYWPLLPYLTVKTLFLAGEYDTKFQAIGQKLTRALPNGQYQKVLETGHNIHLEAPKVFALIITKWLSTGTI